MYLPNLPTNIDKYAVNHDRFLTIQNQSILQSQIVWDCGGKAIDKTAHQATDSMWGIDFDHSIVICWTIYKAFTCIQYSLYLYRLERNLYVFTSIERYAHLFTLMENMHISLLTSQYPMLINEESYAELKMWINYKLLRSVVMWVCIIPTYSI